MIFGVWISNTSIKLILTKEQNVISYFFTNIAFNVDLQFLDEGTLLHELFKEMREFELKLEEFI